MRISSLTLKSKTFETLNLFFQIGKYLEEEISRLRSK